MMILRVLRTAFWERTGVLFFGLLRYGKQDCEGFTLRLNRLCLSCWRKCFEM
jgi:hypothetical protein